MKPHGIGVSLYQAWEKCQVATCKGVKGVASGHARSGFRTCKDWHGSLVGSAMECTDSCQQALTGQLRASIHSLCQLRASVR